MKPDEKTTSVKLDLEGKAKQTIRLKRLGEKQDPKSFAKVLKEKISLALKKERVKVITISSFLSDLNKILLLQYKWNVKQIEDLDRQIFDGLIPNLEV